MNLRYGKAFRIPRKIAKYILSYLIYPITTKIWRLPNVKSIDETLDKIISEKSSISRYGDSEFLYMMDKLSLPYQVYDERLDRRMREILISNEPNILVGLPIGYYSLEGLIPESYHTWRSQIAWIYPRLIKFLKRDKTYYNSSMTRFYYEYKDKNISKGYLEKLLLLWENREVLLIEGEKSRLGVGNDLFSNAINVERILAPKHHAFAKYDELYEEALKHDKSKLVMIALGPTATVLAFDLAKQGYQAIDIGNIDIEYEWYKRGASGKIKIPGKYTSEASGGRVVEDVVDEKYQSQIISQII